MLCLFEFLLGGEGGCNVVGDKKHSVIFRVLIIPVMNTKTLLVNIIQFLLYFHKLQSTFTSHCTR